MNRAACSLIGITLLAGWAASAASAGMPPMGTPIAAFGEGQPMSWNEVVASGMARAVNPATDGVAPTELNFYTGQGQNTAFVASEITPGLPVTLGGQTHDSLVMQWNPLMQGEDLAAAAWQFTLPTQPGRSPGVDLWNGSIHFSFGAPIDLAGGTPIWDVTISLMDKDGRWATWGRSMPLPGWNFYWINFMQGDQDGWFYGADPDFNLTNVVKIRFGEAGSLTTFPLPPDGSPPGFWDWNAWDSVVIVPTPPAAAGMMIVGMTALVRRRRAA